MICRVRVLSFSRTSAGACNCHDDPIGGEFRPCEITEPPPEPQMWQKLHSADSAGSAFLSGRVIGRRIESTFANGTPSSCDQFLDRIAAELLEHRLGEDERHHGFADDGGGGNGADVAAFDRRRADRHRGQIDRAERLHERGDRLHVAGDAQVLAVGDAAFEAAGVVGGARDRHRRTCGRVAGGRISSCTRDPGTSRRRARGRSRPP